MPAIDTALQGGSNFRPPGTPPNVPCVPLVPLVEIQTPAGAATTRAVAGLFPKHSFSELGPDKREFFEGTLGAIQEGLVPPLSVGQAPCPEDHEEELSEETSEGLTSERRSTAPEAALLQEAVADLGAGQLRPELPLAATQERSLPSSSCSPQAATYSPPPAPGKAEDGESSGTESVLEEPEQTRGEDLNESIVRRLAATERHDRRQSKRIQKLERALRAQDGMLDEMPMLCKQLEEQAGLLRENMRQLEELPKLRSLVEMQQQTLSEELGRRQRLEAQVLATERARAQREGELEREHGVLRTQLATALTQLSVAQQEVATLKDAARRVDVAAVQQLRDFVPLERQQQQPQQRVQKAQPQRSQQAQEQLHPPQRQKQELAPGQQSPLQPHKSTSSLTRAGPLLSSMRTQNSRDQSPRNALHSPPYGSGRASAVLAGSDPHDHPIRLSTPSSLQTADRGSMSSSIGSPQLHKCPSYESLGGTRSPNVTQSAKTWKLLAGSPATPRGVVSAPGSVGSAGLIGSAGVIGTGRAFSPISKATVKALEVPGSPASAPSPPQGWQSASLLLAPAEGLNAWVSPQSPRRTPSRLVAPMPTPPRRAPGAQYR